MPAIDCAFQRHDALVRAGLHIQERELPHDEADPDEPVLHTQLGKTPASTVGVPVSRRFLRGNPADELLKLAGNAGVKLIVMGTHGQTAAPEMPLGSIAGVDCLRVRLEP